MSDTLLGIVIGAALSIPLTMVALAALANRASTRARCEACDADICRVCASSAGPCCRAQRGPFR